MEGDNAVVSDGNPQEPQSMITWGQAIKWFYLTKIDTDASETYRLKFRYSLIHFPLDRTAGNDCEVLSEVIDDPWREDIMFDIKSVF